MSTRRRSSRTLRRIAALALAFTLIQGTCIDLWQAALINGFFRGVTPVLQQAAQDAIAAQQAALSAIAEAASKP